jgi:hypothetical protein
MSGKDHGNTICPHLRIADDPDTFYAYPTTLNYCGKAASPGGVSEEHQRAYCLTGDYATCAIFERLQEHPSPSIPPET